MARFQLNPGARGGAHLHQPERVRIGSISIFALVVIICLAVLAVLSFSTANASLTMSQRQATATTELYLDEVAAQEFLAGIDSVLATARTDGAAQEPEPELEFARNDWGYVAYDENGLMIISEKGSSAEVAASTTPASKNDAATLSQAVSAALPKLCAAAEEASGNRVGATAEVFDNRIKADFSCQNGRLLSIVVTIRNNGTYRIDKWKMSAVQNEEPPEGSFFIIDD